MTRLLLVEDDSAIADPLSRALDREGYTVTRASRGMDALAIAAGGEGLDMVILDLGLPDLDGLEVARRLRKGGLASPILILTARADEVDAVVGLDAGADDYVTKPFTIEEVLLRLHRLVQRSGVVAQGSNELVVGDLVMNLDTHEVTRGGEEITLTATQYQLLQYLMENPQRVLSKSQILEAVWNYDFGGQANIVELYISYLRKKIDAGRTPLLHTVRGVGYMIKAPQ